MVMNAILSSISMVFRKPFSIVFEVNKKLSKLSSISLIIITWPLFFANSNQLIRKNQYLETCSILVFDLVSEIAHAKNNTVHIRDLLSQE